MDLRGTFGRRSVMSARRALGLCLVLVISLAAGAGIARSSTVSTKSPNFKPAAGWVIVHAGRDQPYMSSSMVIAVTTPDRSAAHPFGAFTSLKKLSSRVILVWALTIGRNRPTFAPNAVAAAPVGLSARPCLGGPTCSERAAAAQVGRDQRLGHGHPRLLRHATPRQEDARTGAGAARPDCSAPLTSP
jgi:hypothetical protein